MAFFSLRCQMCRNRNEDMNLKAIVAVLAFPRASVRSNGGLNHFECYRAWIRYAPRSMSSDIGQYASTQLASRPLHPRPESTHRAELRHLPSEASSASSRE
jgi:hypothetical protein